MSHLSVRLYGDIWGDNAGKSESQMLAIMSETLTNNETSEICVVLWTNINKKQLNLILLLNIIVEYFRIFTIHDSPFVYIILNNVYH